MFPKVKTPELGYDEDVERLNSATGAALALVIATLALLSLAATPAVAQINGTPASVTSTNFGGHVNSTPGVPASITSLGPNGIQPRNPFPNQPPCCINPPFPANPNPPLFPRRHHHNSGQFFPGGGTVYVPYPVAVESDGYDPAADARQQQDDENYRGGPTIFDRRGPGTPAPSFTDAYAQRTSRAPAEAESTPASPAPDASVPDQPQTVLMFKDGHQLEVQNYAVVGDMLYELTPGRHHKIAIADLDLSATTKQNDERGIDFRLPPSPEANK